MTRNYNLKSLYFCHGVILGFGKADPYLLAVVAKRMFCPWLRYKWVYLLVLGMTCIMGLGFWRLLIFKFEEGSGSLILLPVDCVETAVLW
jgi:hypothetical protein